VSRTDQEQVLDAPDHIAVLHDHLARGEMADSLIADAVCLRLAAAIDSVAQTTPNFRDRIFGDVWPVMWATRNRIAHGYAFIDMSIIRSTVERDLPGFESRLKEQSAGRANRHPYSGRGLSGDIGDLHRE